MKPRDKKPLVSKQFVKKHIRTILIVYAALAIFVIGSTVAFFSSRDEITNRFVASQFDLLLTETKWDPNSGRDLVPGDEVAKNPQVTNNERTDGYIFLRVTVPCDTQMVDQDDGQPLEAQSANVPMYKFVVVNADNSETVDTSFTAKQAVHSQWIPVHGDDPENEYPRLVTSELTLDGETVTVKQLVYVYAYSTDGTNLLPLKEGATTEPLFDKLLLWNFNENFNPKQSHSVRVEALGIQANLNGYTPDQIEEIWQLLEGDGA